MMRWQLVSLVEKLVSNVAAIEMTMLNYHQKLIVSILLFANWVFWLANWYFQLKLASGSAHLNMIISLVVFGLFLVVVGPTEQDVRDYNDLKRNR